PRPRDVLRADARAWPLPDETAALAVIDSPYSDNIAYGRDPRCLGRISCRDPRFYEEMRRVAAEARRVLVPGGILAWIIADEYRGGVYTPAGFRLLTVLSEAFEPIDPVIATSGIRRVLLAGRRGPNVEDGSGRESRSLLWKASNPLPS